jgi:acetoacetate decarboxylase
VDGTARICELVCYHLEDVRMKGAWEGPAALSLTPHALAPVADLPVLEVIGAKHFVADLTLGLGKVVFDYLADRGADRAVVRSQPRLVHAIEAATR